MDLRSTQPLTEMSTRNLPGSKGRPVRKVDTLTAICEVGCPENVGASTSHNPMASTVCYSDSLLTLLSTFSVYDPQTEIKLQ
jgi:hypothetical protein